MFSYLNFKRIFTRKRGWTGILPYVRRAYPVSTHQQLGSIIIINVILQHISIHVLTDKTQLQEVLESKMYFYFLLSLINNL